MSSQDVFQGHQFVLDLPPVTSYKEKQLLREKITKNNGIISYTVNRKTDYVIRMAAMDDSSYRMRIAAKYGVKVVTADFVDVCLEKGKLVDSKLYIVSELEQDVKNLFADGKIVTTMDVKLKSRSPKLSQIKTWLYKDRDGPTFHSDPYAVVKAVVLKGKEKQVGYPFCVIEIHCNLTNESGQDLCLKYCVFTHQGVLPVPSDIQHFGTKACRFMQTSVEALDVFDQLYKLYTYPPNSMSCCKTFLSHKGLGSDCFHVEDWLLASVLVEAKVAQFVADIWTEVVHVLEYTLSGPLRNIQENQIVQAESLLIDISKALKNNDMEKVTILSTEYQNIMPHTSQLCIDSSTLINIENNLCQLLRDYINLQESITLSDRNTVEQQYYALHCDIQVLDNDSTEYKDIASLLKENKHDLKLRICNIFKVHRTSEDVYFTYGLENKKLLFQGTNVENSVGILSRGMLLFKDIFAHALNLECGSVLGPGLYFTDELTAAINYAMPSKTNGRRIIMVNEVALGQCYNTYSSCPKFASPPQGYNSVCGLKREIPEITSDFKYNEYVIYNINQQKLKYVVEFSQPADKSLVSCSPPAVQANPLLVNPCLIVSASSVEEHTMTSFDIQQFLRKHTTDAESAVIGLQSQYSDPIPLKSVHVRAKLVDLAAEVVIMQEYCNDTATTIEARYVFPLDDKAAVCGFEAYSDGQHFIGRIEEKKHAQMEYKEAVESGKKAYLMDEEAPDVFKVSIGNVHPHSTVLVKIRYVAELDFDGDLISFRLPAAVHPWQQELGLKSHLQSVTKTADVSDDHDINTSVEVFVDMPYDIKSIYSPTHQVKAKKTASHAVVSMDNNANLKDGFQLLIGLSDIHVPRMWVEKHPDHDSSACMLTFYPEFVSNSTPDVEVIVALDASNSMSGSVFSAAQQIAILCLHYLLPDAKFNVLVFGSVYYEAFPSPRQKSLEEIYEAQQFIFQSQPVLGSSKISHFLRSFFHLKPQANTLRSIYIISDGYLLEDDVLLRSSAHFSNHTRIFCLGVGKFVNHHLLNKISHAGAGSYEFFDENRKSKWAAKAQIQMLKAEEPVLTNINLEWQQFNDRSPEIIQAPQQIPAIFSGSRVVVYGFVNNCSLAVLQGNVAGTEVNTTVFTSELGKSTGTTLHCLTTKALVRDWENGFLDQDRVCHEVCKRSFASKIIALSKQYSIITPLTSFVAIEDKDNTTGEGYNGQPSIEEFVQAECVDFLQYLSFQTVSCDAIDYSLARRNDKRRLDETCSSVQHDDVVTIIPPSMAGVSQMFDLNVLEVSRDEGLTTKHDDDSVEDGMEFRAMLTKRKYCKWEVEACEEMCITKRKVCKKKALPKDEFEISCEDVSDYLKESEVCYPVCALQCISFCEAELPSDFNCNQPPFSKEQFKVSSISLGSGLPFLSLIFRQLVSNIGLIKLRPVKEQIGDMLHCNTDEMCFPVLNSCNFDGGIELDDLPKEWNNQLWSEIQLQLVNNGLKSLGSVVENFILRLIATLAIVLAIFHKLKPELFPLDLTNPSSIKDVVMNISENFQEGQIDLTTQLCLVRSILFIISINQRHPLVYRTLELGNSWEEAFYVLSSEQKLIENIVRLQ